jgi:hypothetical protein
VFSSSLLGSVVNLDGPGRYLHWSIFTVSEANLFLIAMMVVIFGAALLIRFPSHQADDHDGGPDDGNGGPISVSVHTAPPLASDFGEDADAAMWTSRIRRRALKMLPPGKLLPDRQPAYVASWIYVFGVASLATFGDRDRLGFSLSP